MRSPSLRKCANADASLLDASGSSSRVSHDQSIAPIEESEKQHQRHPRRGANAPWPNAALLVRHKFAAAKEVLRYHGSPWSERQYEDAGQVGNRPKDDSSRHDHTKIMPQVGEGSATGSGRPVSNTCGAQGRHGFHAVCALRMRMTPIQDRYARAPGRGREAAARSAILPGHADASWMRKGRHDGSSTRFAPRLRVDDDWRRLGRRNWRAR